MRNALEFLNLTNPGNIASAFQTGLENGRKTREEREVRGALSAYAVNPDDPKAFTTLAQYKPELAIKLREDQTKRAQQAQVQKLTGLAATGDKAAMAQLAGIDLDAWVKLSDNQRQQVKAQTEFVGNAALAISRLPADQRRVAWDQYIQQGAQQFPELAQYQGQYSEEALNGALAKAGMVKQFIDMNEPKYQAITAGGTLVNTSDPNAVQSYMGMVTGGGAAPSGPPPAAVDHLRKNPGLKAAFDEKYGPGASDRVLQGGGAASRVTSNFLDGL